MIVTPESPWRYTPRCTFETFERLLRERGNPTILQERDAVWYWGYIVSHGVDPLFVLAMFKHESSMGNAGVALQTFSWGNTRNPTFGDVPKIPSETHPGRFDSALGTVPGRTGVFPKFRDWLDGLKSTVGRLIEPTWYYNDRASIREIFDHPSGVVWAPAGDRNNPQGYLADVIAFMNMYADADTTMQAELPGFQWLPEMAGEFGYPRGTHGRNGHDIDRLLMHFTAGRDSLDWLRFQHENSAHLLTNRDGTPRAQMVALADAAWAAGNREYNERGVQLEHEATEAEALNPAYWTDELIGNLAVIASDVIRKCPKILPDREHIIGHNEVPDPYNPGLFGGAGNHSDPGPAFPWDRFIAAVRSELGIQDPQPQPPPQPVPDVPESLRKAVEYPNGKWVPMAFDAHHRAFGGLRAFGLPVSGMIVDDGRYTQFFERAVLRYFPENQGDDRVQGDLLGVAELARRYPGGI